MRRLFILLTVLPLSACYYLQAARGQADLLFSQQRVDKVIADPDTPNEQRDKLRLASEALTFAHEQLSLPDNGSYRRFVALEHDYVVVNVFAAPVDSLAPETWCYPFIGCLAYRGYFSRAAADRFAERLAARGLDVGVRKVPAYSTLGRFRDPLLSTMLTRSDEGLVSLLFHELSHQLFYAADDTAFNESFASFVAEVGLQRWRQHKQLPANRQLERRAQQRRQLLAAVEAARRDLEALYASSPAMPVLKQRKAARFAELAAEWRALGALARPPANNAQLLPLAIYNDLTPAFAELLAQCADELRCLYERASLLAELPADERAAAVDALLAATQKD